jgi:hypothetical protein
MKAVPDPTPQRCMQGGPGWVGGGNYLPGLKKIIGFPLIFFWKFLEKIEKNIRVLLMFLGRKNYPLLGEILATALSPQWRRDVPYPGFFHGEGGGGYKIPIFYFDQKHRGTFGFFKLFWPIGGGTHTPGTAMRREKGRLGKHVTKKG